MRLQLVLLGLLVLVCAVGCQKDEALPPHQGGSTTTPSSQPADSGTSVPAAEVPATTTSAPVAAASSGGTVVASTEGEQSGVTAQVTELKRGTGGTLMMKFTIINSGTDNFDFGWALGEPGHGGDYSTIGGVHLIDPVNKKKYFVVRDADGKCVCSRDLGSVKPGGRVNLWAKLPAPGTDVQRVSVVIPKFIPMDDVPLS